ncbi:MAG: pentapeptide repeat-containing protein, partial [Spirochaetaceae bacterium]|nr:pentapeptide repeat-containing protein [Spirochaetaceae bacterium]
TMFKNVPCVAGCGNAAVSGSDLCGLHCVDPQKEAARISENILSLNNVCDLSAGYLRFKNKDFSSKHFSGCNFTESYFESCAFNGSTFRMTFFDASVFIDCDFSNSDMEFVSFGLCVFENCKFNDSELIHLNFNGATISQCSFDHSDLYSSRFNMAKIARTTIADCNVKNVFFINCGQDDVSFKSSNTKDAFFELEK